jgi:uncharacterized protein (UPF0548 family)
MFLLNRPDGAAIEAFLSRNRDAPFSYAEVGATRSVAPAGYTVDRYRLRLGDGIEAFERAAAAVRCWAMFDTGWTQLCPPGAPIATGSVVCSLVRHLGFWSLNACRLVYTIDESADEPSGIRRTGFAFGSLLDHSEQGEERFCVSYHLADETVWYDVLAFSRPRHLLARLGYPLARGLQKRFIRDSQRAVARAVSLRESPPQ